MKINYQTKYFSKALHIKNAAFLMLASQLLLPSSLLANEATETTETTETRQYKNETAIVFETMGGKKTDAFEGSISVKENRNNPNSRMIQVKYVRFPGTGKELGSPIIYLSGGPGGSGIQTARYPNFRFPLFMALREFADVIALDQRGTGASNDVEKCTSNTTIPTNKVTTDQQIAEYYQQAATECLKFWDKQGADVLGYTTVQNALDLDDLRKHLQADKISLWGISYGSHLALTALKELPNKIDKVIMASAEGLNQTVKFPARTDAYFERLQQAINTQPAAAKVYPDIRKLIMSVHKQLEKNPILLQIPQKDGKSMALLFQRQHMQILTSMSIADPQRGVKRLLALYLSLNKGEHGMLVEMLKRGYFDDKAISFKVMSLAMDVASGITDERLQKVNQQAKGSLVGKYLNFPMPQLNKSIEGLDLGDEFRMYAKSDVATLLLTGTLDGRTYIQSQIEATQGLSNLTKVKVVNAGHNLFMVSPDVTEAIKQFMAGEEVTHTEITVQLPSFVD